MSIIEKKKIARESVVSQVLPHLSNPVQIGSGEYSVKTDCFDDEGNPMYAVVKITVKNVTATEKSVAFNEQAAHDAYLAKVEKAKIREENRSKNTTVNKEEREAKRAKNAEKEAKLIEVVSAYIVNVTEEEPQRASAIKEAIPELADETIMYVGTLMKKVVERGFAKVKVIERSKHYFG